MIPNGERWVVVASGPSMLSIDMGLLRRAQPRWRVLVVNCSHELAPWADAMYAGDLAWWVRYADDTVKFAGQKWTRDAHAALRFKLSLIRACNRKGLCRDTDCVAIGGNSGYQAVNLAWHFGARDIVLLGFDMHRHGGAHWHGEHAGMLSAPVGHIPIWRRNFKDLAFDLRAAGVRVVNATPGTALGCFPCATLSEALRC